MCRLAFIPGKTQISTKQLVSFFTQLQKSFGGDGNGYAAVSPDGRTVINKGIKLGCNTIAKEVSPLIKQGWSIYFHTRKISVGWSSDEQCHPFAIDGESHTGVMCHNGTWSEGATLAKYLDTGSDTATLAYLIGELGLEELDRRKLMPRSGIFLLYGGAPETTASHKVLNLGGSLEYCPETGVWASEFFQDWPFWKDTYRVKEGAHMLEKAPPKASKVITTTGSYYYGKGYTQYSKPSTSVKNSGQLGLDQYWEEKNLERQLEEIEEQGLILAEEIADAEYLLDDSDNDDYLGWQNRIHYHN